MYAIGLTDKGQTREQNQDSIFFSTTPVGPLPNLFIVADGMGGHNAGDVASTHAVNFVKDYIRNFQVSSFVLEENYLDLLVSSVQDANAKVLSLTDIDPKLTGMGTTLTACVVTQDKMLIAHVGDSRAYTIINDKITQITTDHTYVERMLKTGQITKEEADSHPKRHILTRVLGTDWLFEADGLIIPTAGHEVTILLCSDGLTNMVADDKILEIVTAAPDLDTAAAALIKEANENGGFDNISAVLINTRGDKI